MPLLFNMLSRLVTAFLPRSKCLLISWLQSTICSDFGTQENQVSHCFHCLPIWCLLLLLLLSCFSRVWLCATPEKAAHQAPPSLGFSRQEHWSGLPFPSPMHESEKWKWSRSVVSDPSWPHGLQPIRLLRPWDFPDVYTAIIHSYQFGPANPERPSESKNNWILSGLILVINIFWLNLFSLKSGYFHND